MGNGLKNILKIHGQMKVNDVLWIWDYLNDEPRIKSEMTKDEIKKSDEAKLKLIKFKNLKNIK